MSFVPILYLLCLITSMFLEAENGPIPLCPIRRPNEYRPLKCHNIATSVKGDAGNLRHTSKEAKSADKIRRTYEMVRI